MSKAIQKIKKKTKKVLEKVKGFSSEELSGFEQFLNVVRGKADIKSRIRVILDPDNLKTTTQLTGSQVDFVALSHFVADEFPEFEPVRTFAELFCECNVSRGGWGVDSSIKLNAAISESKLMQGLILKSDVMKEKGITGKT